MLGAAVRHSGLPHESSSADSLGGTEGCLGAAGGGGEGVVIKEPPAVHDTPDPHGAAQHPHQAGHAVQVDEDPGPSRTAAHQVEFPASSELLPAEELLDDLRQYLRPKEGEPLVGSLESRAGPGVTGAVGDQDMVGVSKVGILLGVAGENPPHGLHLRPLVGGHQSLQPQPASLTAGLVVAEPAALQVDDPPPTVRIPPDVITGSRTVIAGDVLVVEIFPAQPVLQFVPPPVEDGRQLSEGLLGQELTRVLLKQRLAGHGGPGEKEKQQQHPGT